nr:unnamed protein product [Salmo salar]|eukprot:XP_013999339.1 PREDICTED: trichohyalin-like isoform X2 [Salmo salar]
MVKANERMRAQSLTELQMEGDQAAPEPRGLIVCKPRPQADLTPQSWLQTQTDQAPEPNQDSEPEMAAKAQCIVMDIELDDNEWIDVDVVYKGRIVPSSEIEEAKQRLLTEAEEAEQRAQAGKAEQKAQAEKAEQKAQAEKAEQKAQAEKAEQKAQAEKAEQKAQAEKAEQKAQAEKAEQKAQAEKAEQKAQAEKAEQKAQAEKAEQKAQAEKAEQKAQAEKAEQKAQAEKAEQKAQAEAFEIERQKIIAELKKNHKQFLVDEDEAREEEEEEEEEEPEGSDCSSLQTETSDEEEKDFQDEAEKKAFIKNSKCRRAVYWLNKIVRQNHETKIKKTFVNEEKKGDQLVIKGNLDTGMTCAMFEQKKRAKLLRAMEERKKVEEEWLRSQREKSQKKQAKRQQKMEKSNTQPYPKQSARQKLFF